jgi:hypothetical protein
LARSILIDSSLVEPLSDQFDKLLWKIVDEYIKYTESSPHVMVKVRLPTLFFVIVQLMTRRVGCANIVSRAAEVSGATGQNDTYVGSYFDEWMQIFLSQLNLGFSITLISRNSGGVSCGASGASRAWRRTPSLR